MKEIIKQAFKKALLEFKAKDFDIMQIDSSERAKVHRVAMYLENIINNGNSELKDFIVDCEYNLVEGSKKRLPQNFYNDNKEHTFYFYPDLIVHKRNSKDNLFCCEFKNKNSSIHDKRKITHLITDEKYQYSVGSIFVFKNMGKEDFEENINFYDKQNLPQC